jgi:maltooligosyltrehalose trehalohydrolase
VRWRVWAPRARQVDLILIDGPRRRRASMAAEGRGFFLHTEDDVPEGQRYAFRLDGGPERPDPCSLWQPDGVHRPSAVLFPERFPWSGRAWAGLKRADLVFYELHVGTFTPEGTFDAVIPRLEALRDLGVTALELMPVAQFPGTCNWGYDGVHLAAPQNSYGGPHGLQRLVDACHARGLAVFLDVVYNHFGPEGNYLAEFGPYFSERYRTAWGPAFNYDGAGSDAVRDFVLDNVRLWVEAYRLDGLRLDAVHAMYDASPTHILREIQQAAGTAHVIAESNRNDVRILEAPGRGGYGLSAQWNDDFHHAVHAYLTGERAGHYVDFGRAQDFPKLLERTFLLDGGYSHYRGRRHGAPASDLPGDRFVVCVQNHDQVGNRARGERLATLLGPAALRLAASLLLLAPRLPLLFMGEEYGEEAPFLFFCSFLDPQLIENVRRGRRRDYAAFFPDGEVPDPQAEATFAASRLTWSWPEGSPREGLRLLYRDLLAARRHWPALRDFVHKEARLLPDERQAAVLQLVRGSAAGPGPRLRALYNLTDQFQPLLEGAVRVGAWLFSSEARRYHGNRPQGEKLERLWPYECVVFEAGG